jgi:hypothetical protein
MENFWDIHVSSEDLDASLLPNVRGKTFGQVRDELQKLHPDVVLAVASSRDGQRIESENEIHLTRRMFAHTHCAKVELAVTVETRFRGMFKQAGFKPEACIFERIANEYGSEDYNGPWFKVTTPFGMISVGWRRHVIAIDWSATKRDLGKRFEKFKVTYGAHGVHAYGYDQGTEFLEILHNGLQS